jgi:nitroreductase
VYWVQDSLHKKRVLELQFGNRGFGETAGEILVITTDILTVFGQHERKQIFVDGGLYSMTLLNALHYVGLGVCPLNWGVFPKRDRMLKDALDIPASQEVILILAIGELPDEVVAAKSIKKTVSDTLHIV